MRKRVLLVFEKEVLVMKINVGTILLGISFLVGLAGDAYNAKKDKQEIIQEVTKEVMKKITK